MTSFKEPHQDNYDPICNIDPDIIEKTQTHYESTYRSITNRNLASQFTSFLSSSFSKRLRASIRITADQAKTYYLNNPSQWFRNAVQLPEARKWIERVIDEGADIYVIVAYHTLQDAQITENRGAQSTAGGNIVIPVSTALAASGVVVPLGNLTDPGLEGSHGQADNEQRNFIARGEQVFAVQYRKVRCRWFASSKIDKITLAKKTWWEKYDRPRYLQSEAEDGIEVELGDDVVFEGDCYDWATGSGEVFILSTPD